MPALSYDVLTLLATVVLVLHMPSVSALADVAREADGTRHGGLGGDLFHAGGGLLVLLVIGVLNVYKPRGLTPYGWRKQQEERARLARRASAASRPKVSGGQ